MRVKLSIFVVLFIAVSLFFLVDAQIPPAAGTNKIEKQILDINGKQEGPLSVSGRYIVYMQDGNVWLHDAGDLFKQDDDKGTIQITKDGRGDKYTFPVIDRGNGRQVAWIGDKKDIFVYDIKTKETKKLESQKQIIEAFDVEQKEIINAQPVAEQSVVISDNRGGAIVAWISLDDKGLISFIDSQGNIKNKIKFSDLAGEIMAMTSNGQGGAIVGWTEDQGRIFIRFVDSQGILGNPIMVADQDGNDKILVSLISDNQGGAIGAIYSENGIIVSFIDSQGNVKNINIPDSVNGIPNIALDGQGGAILTWVSEQENKMFALFIDKQGNLGNKIFIDDTGDADEFLPAIASDTKGGAIIGYSASDPQGSYIFVRFLKNDGSLSNSINIPFVGPLITELTFPVLASDGQGGAIVVYGSGGGIFSVLINAQGGAGDSKKISDEVASSPFLSINRNGQNGYLLSWISDDLFLDFLDLQGNSVKIVNVEPVIGGERVIKTVSRNFQLESKENLYLYNGILAWDQYDRKFGGRDIRGYNLNEPGGPDIQNALDRHYFFLVDLEIVNAGGNEFQINEIKPVISGDSIYFIGDSVRDLGDFGVDFSQELFNLDNFLRYDIFAQDRRYSLISQQDDGCNVVEASAERGLPNVIWTEFCPSISTSKLRRNIQQPITTSDTSTFHSPLLKNDHFYIEKNGNELILKSNLQDIINKVDLSISTTGEKVKFSINGVEHEIEITEVVDFDARDFKLKFDGTEFELIGADTIRIGDFEIGSNTRGGGIACGGPPPSCFIPVKVEELYFVSGTSMDIDKYRLAYLKNDNIETIAFPDIIQDLGDVSLLRIIPDGKGGTIIVWMSQSQGQQGIHVNFLDAQGNFRFKEPIVPFRDWVNSRFLEITSDGNGGVFIIFRSNTIQAIAIDSNGNIKFGPKSLDLPNTNAEEIALIEDGQGGAIAAFTSWENNLYSLYAIIIKSDGNVIGPILVTKDIQYSWQSLSIGSYGDGGAMVSWMENIGGFGFFGSVAKYAFIDAQGNLKDFSEGKFPTIEEAQQQQGQFIRGDANGDGAADMTDAIFILRGLFLGEEQPKCLDAADVDDTGIVDMTDAIYLLQRLFTGGQEIPPPYPDAGEDTTDDTLSCGEQKAKAALKKRLFP